jgi:hypothetical protein
MADAQQELIAYEQELRYATAYARTHARTRYGALLTSLAHRAKQRGKKEVVPPGNAAGERKGIKRLLERRSMDFSSSPRKNRGTEAYGMEPTHTTHAHTITRTPTRYVLR